jgi:hypothetical protein
MRLQEQAYTLRMLLANRATKKALSPIQTLKTNSMAQNLSRKVDSYSAGQKIRYRETVFRRASYWPV